MVDSDRIRRVTANFFFWQGLRWVPFGVLLLLEGLVLLAPPERRPLAALTFVPLVGAVDRGRQAVALLMAAVGAVYVVGGVLDHWELVRLMPPAPARREDLDGSPV